MAIDADLNSGLITEQEARKEEMIFKDMQIFMVLWMELLNLLKEILLLV